MNCNLTFPFNKFQTKNNLYFGVLMNHEVSRVEVGSQNPPKIDGKLIEQEWNKIH